MKDQPDKDSADTDDTMQAPPSEEPETAIVASDTSTVDATSWPGDGMKPMRFNRQGTGALSRVYWSHC
jgi:hypothetical protein